MRELMDKDVHQILREVALMEISLSKISVESEIEIPTKVVILTEEGAAVLREDMSPIEEIIDHVTRSVDKGVVTAVVVVYKAKLAMVSEEDVEGMLHMALGDRVDPLQEFKEAGQDVVICAIQYQVDGVGRHSLAVSAEIVVDADGGSTIGPLELFACVNNAGEDIPLSPELMFDTSKFVPWKEN